MKERFEWTVHVAVVAVLSGFVFAEGKRNVDLQGKLPISAQELYKKVAKSQTKVQIVDIREGEEAYDDTHIPGAIPFPNCDVAAAPEKARDQIFSFVPTVVVSKDGDPQAYARCLQHFQLARNLAGGIDGWVEAGLPEDSGEYAPPRNSAGGGCL